MRSLAHKSKHGLDLVVVDYIQIVDPGAKYANQDQELREISKNLKKIAKSLSVPVVALSQFSRGIEHRNQSAEALYKEPKLHDLRGSGNIEQDADGVWAIWCTAEEAQKELERADATKSETEGLTKVRRLSILKQRNGPKVWFDLEFNPKAMRFSEPQQTRQEPKEIE